jgi:hypothetical protein
MLDVEVNFTLEIPAVGPTGLVDHVLLDTRGQFFLIISVGTLAERDIVGFAALGSSTPAPTVVPPHIHGNAYSVIRTAASTIIASTGRSQSNISIPLAIIPLLVGVVLTAIFALLEIPKVAYFSVRLISVASRSATSCGRPSNLRIATLAIVAVRPIRP